MINLNDEQGVLERKTGYGNEQSEHGVFGTWYWKWGGTIMGTGVKF